MRNYEDNFQPTGFPDIDRDRAKIFELERRVLNMQWVVDVLMQAVATLLHDANSRREP